MFVQDEPYVTYKRIIENNILHNFIDKTFYVVKPVRTIMRTDWILMNCILIEYVS